MTRPYRQRKHDRLFHYAGTSREEIAVDHAVAPFDRMARELDKKWGVDRLEELVSPATAARYGSALAQLNEAIAAVDIDRAVDRASNCMRGMTKMQAEALEAGHQPADPEIIIAQADDFLIGILADERLWERAAEKHPGLRLYTLREVALLAQAAQTNNPLLDAAKAIPGAEIVAIREKRTRMVDDEIPF